MTIDECNLVVVGEPTVGKTAIIISFLYKDFMTKYDPTIEDIYPAEIDDAMFGIVDTAGQEEFRSMLDVWIRKGECFALVYDITNKQSFDKIDHYHKQIERQTQLRAVAVAEEEAKAQECCCCPFLETSAHSGNTSANVVLVGNKSDLSSQLRAVTIAEGEAKAQDFFCPFLETSAQSGHNIDEIFSILANQAKMQTKLRDQDSKKRWKFRSKCIIL